MQQLNLFKEFREYLRTEFTSYVFDFELKRNWQCFNFFTICPALILRNNDLRVRNHTHLKRAKPSNMINVDVGKEATRWQRGGVRVATGSPQSNDNL